MESSIGRGRIHPVTLGNPEAAEDSLTFGTGLASAGIDLLVLRELMGHVHAEVTAAPALAVKSTGGDLLVTTSGSPPGLGINPRQRWHWCRHDLRPPKAAAGDRADHTQDCVHHDRVDKSRKITLRYQGRLHSIGIGQTHTRTHTRTRVVLLVQDLHVRIVDATTGELLRELAIDPRHDYQPTGRPPRPARRHPK